MSNWGIHTYEEMAHKLGAYFERRIHETGLGRYELDVVHRWEEVMLDSTGDSYDVRALITLLEDDDRVEGLHGGTAWEEVRLVIHKWAAEYLGSLTKK